jgi:lipopolysaccharide/colanic/teichoic acid biosynthesis glycosyltransferase
MGTCTGGTVVYPVTSPAPARDRIACMDHPASVRTHRVYDAVTRALNLIIALVALVVLSPVLLVVAAIVLTTLGRPVIFTQHRPGMNGRPIAVHKFRTMRAADPALSAVDQVASDAARLTRVGRMLRAASLDELPQLYDVLVGSMNLVGPRPLLTEYLGLYSPHHARRHEVRPGITGWSQVNGRNEASWDDRLDMDVWYVDNRSLALDARILWRTIAVALSGKGVSAEGVATAVPYSGSAGHDTPSEPEDER